MPGLPPRQWPMSNRHWPWPNGRQTAAKSPLLSWLARRPLIDRLQEGLRRELGDQAYHAAWERAQGLTPGMMALEF